VVPVIRTERLELVPLSIGAMRATLERDLQRASAELGAEVPPDIYERLGGLFMLHTAQFEVAPDGADWLARAMVVIDGGGPLRPDVPLRRRMIGSVGFHSAPTNGVVEIGYHVEPGYRREGYASEAVRAMLDWAADHGIHRIRAAVSPTNTASLGVVRQFGFRQTGSQWDEEDGEELVFMVDWPPATSAAGGPAASGGPASTTGEAS
jgi:[ribosomal protein S5]-alanine N-acetyltransferase